MLREVVYGGKIMGRFDDEAARSGADFPAGAAVFRQGDTGGEMYFIHSGTVGITREQGGLSTELAWLKKGDFFGEMALVDGSPRSATATCLTPCRLLPVPRGFLERFNQSTSEFLFLVLEGLIGKLESTTPLVRRKYVAGEGGDEGEREPKSAPFLSAFAAAADLKRYRRLEAGSVVFAQGDPGDFMYIVLEGRVAVSRQEKGRRGGRKGGRLTVLAELGRGDFFGEMALVSGNPRLASVTALTPVVLMPVDRDLFIGKARENPEVARHLVAVLILRLRRVLASLD
jgi:cAMP-dependent protein kinase regulator